MNAARTRARVRAGTRLLGRILFVLAVIASGLLTALWLGALGINAVMMGYFLIGDPVQGWVAAAVLAVIALGALWATWKSCSARRTVLALAWASPLMLVPGGTVVVALIG